MIDLAKLTLAQIDATVRTLTGQLRMTGNAGQDADAEPMDAVEIVQPLGLIARPALTETTEALYVRVGNDVLVIGVLDKGAGPMADLEEGETRLYGTGNAASNVRCRPSGETDVNSAPDHPVVVNGGDLPVARQTDGVAASTAMRTFLHALTLYINGIAPGTLVEPLDDIGAISGGAGLFRA